MSVSGCNDLALANVQTIFRYDSTFSRCLSTLHSVLPRLL